jgi:Uma2 family endonuclease
MPRTTTTTRRKPGEVFYPEEDDFKMGETDSHSIARMLLRQALEDFFAAQRTVYIASDLFLYWVEGSPQYKRAPDAMVVKGVSRRRRRIFQTWREGAVPCAVFEIVSMYTYLEDTGPKFRDYATIGVREYFLFDPEGEHLDPALLGYELQGGEYVQLMPAADGSLGSRELGLRMRAEESMLRLIDAATGTPIPTRDERAEQERRAKEQERQRAEQERRAKEQERQRADALAKKVERLEAELDRLQAPKQPSRRGKKKP